MILIILAAVLGAAAPILVHEWGHASAARRLVASGATAGVWIVAGAVVSALVTRWIG